MSVLHVEVGGITTWGHGSPISAGMPTVDSGTLGIKLCKNSGEDRKYYGKSLDHFHRFSCFSMSFSLGL
jgi:hypothetical protein